MQNASNRVAFFAKRTFKKEEDTRSALMKGFWRTLTQEKRHEGVVRTFRVRPTQFSFNICWRMYFFFLCESNSHLYVYCLSLTLAMNIFSSHILRETFFSLHTASQKNFCCKPEKKNITLTALAKQRANCRCVFEHRKKRKEKLCVVVLFFLLWEERKSMKIQILFRFAKPFLV